MDASGSGINQEYDAMPPLEPPYYAVIFSSQRSAGDDPAYLQAADRMMEFAALQPGYLGIQSVRGADGFGITVSYWASPESIAAWKANAEHLAAQHEGKRKWYEHYELEIARVERCYRKAPT